MPIPRARVPLPPPRPSSFEIAIEDLLEGPLELTSGQTMRGMRTFFVPDVQGAGVRVLAAALLAQNVPRYRDPWPDLPQLLCSEVTARPSNGPTDFEIIASYGPLGVGDGDPFDNPPGDDVVPFLDIVSSVVMKRTSMDIDGVPIVISNYTETPLGGQPVLMPAQSGEVDVPVRNTVLRYRRREWPEDSQGRLIGDKCVNWTGVTNEELFLGFAIGSILVVVGASSDDGNETFNVTYELHINIPDTWDPTVVWRDPETGRPGKQVGGIDIGGFLGNGIKRVIVTHRRKLSELDLQI